MAGDTIGRKVTISVDGTIIGQARTKSLTVNNSAINVTTDDDDGIQKLLSEPGEKAVEISVDGLYLSTDTSLLDLSLTNDLVKAVVFDYGAGLYTINGDFFMTSYNEGLPYNEAITFSASFSSAAAVTKTLTP